VCNRTATLGSGVVRLTVHAPAKRRSRSRTAETLGRILSTSRGRAERVQRFSFRFFARGIGSSRVVIRASSLSHSPSST